MSYRNPKYINQSVQGSFDKLQNTINASVTQAKKVEKDQELAETARKNKEMIAGVNQSQATITQNASHNTVGNEMSRGKVETYFGDYPARSAEIAMELAKTPKPENFTELQAELKWINDSPETMKNMLTNAQSFLNIKDFNDIDPHQNSDILLASQVFNGKSGYTEANGFTFDFQKGDGGSIEMVFKGKGYIPPYPPGYKGEKDPSKLQNFGPDGYTMNSAGMQSMADNDQSLIVSTPKMSTQINSALKDTGILAGAIYNDQGAYKSGGVFNKDLLGTETKEYTGADGKIVVLKLVDPNKVAASMKATLDQQINSFISPENGDNGKAISLWNMRIAGKSASVDFNEEKAKKAFPNETDIDVLKEKWKKGSGNWGYDQPNGLTLEQKAVFDVMYRELIVNDVVETMESNELVNQRIDRGLTEGTKAGSLG